MIPVAFFAALAISATEICRHTRDPGDQPVQNLPSNASINAQCLLCSDTAAAAPRPGTLYLVNGACSWTKPTPGIVNVGAYTLAAGQHLVSVAHVRGVPLGHPDAELILSGALKATAPESGIHYINLTKPFVARGKSVANLVVEHVHVDTEKTAVLLLNPKTSDTVDATGARILQTTGSGDAVVGMVHVTGPGILVKCTSATDMVAVQTFLPTDFVDASSCKVLNLTALFDVLGNAVTNAMYDVPPPEWLRSIQAFNFHGTGWLILLTVLFFVVKPQKEKTD